MQSSTTTGARTLAAGLSQTTLARLAIGSLAAFGASCGGSGSGATIPLDPPSALAYPVVSFDLVRDVQLPPLVPDYDGGSATFTVTPALPAGLYLNAATGAVTGIPQVALAPTTFAVEARNGSGRVTATFQLEIHDAFDAPKFVYALHADTNEISCWRHDAGANVLVPLGRVNTGNFPIRVEVDPLGRFLYVALGGQEGIAVHRIDQATGLLQPVEVFDADGATFDLCIDPSGRFLYKSNLHVGTLQSFRIDPTNGFLVPVGASVLVPGPSGLTVARDGRSLFAGSIDGNAVMHFRVDEATGAIESLAGAVGAGSPVDLYFDDAVGRLYVADFLGNRLLTYLVDADDGRPQLLFETPTPGGPASIVRNGAELNVACHSDPLVQRYKLDGPGGAPTDYGALGLSGRPTKAVLLGEDQDLLVALDSAALLAQIEQADAGDLALVDQRTCVAQITDVVVVRGPRGYEFTTEGLFTATANSLELSAFRVDDAGVTPAGLPQSIGLAPSALAVDALGRRLYVVESGSDSVTSFAIDAETLELERGATTAAGLEPKDAALLPGSATLVTVDEHRIALWRTGAAGALTLLDQEAIGSMPRHVAVDPSGRFAYVTAGDDVHAFAVDARAGLLSHVAPSGLSFAAGSRPSGLAIAPGGTTLVVALEGAQALHVAALDPVDGALTSQSTLATGFVSLDPTFDARGERLYTVEPADDAMSLFSIDASLTLTLLSRADCGQNSNAVAVDRRGDRAFGLGAASDSIEVVGVGANQTTLQPAGTVGVGAGSAPSAVATFAAWRKR
jgi:6-phosphogluconolactonase (cycloisomerase 2 family)